MNNDFQTEGLFELGFDSVAKQSLRTAATWAKVIAIIAFISYALSLVTVLVLNPFAGVDTADSGVPFGDFGRTAQIVVTALFILIGVLLNLFLFRFAAKAINAIDGADQHSLDTSFDNLRVYFKVIGIFILIFLALLVLALVFTIIMGAMTR